MKPGSSAGKTSACDGVARRGGRCPAWAPTVAVGLAGRLRCASRSALARRNSLHSLRSLRSDSRRESDHEARAARVPSALLRCSPPHKSPTPGTAHRAERSWCSTRRATVVPAKPWVGVRRQRHCAAPRSTGLVAARAQRALRHLTRRDCPSAANEVSEASFAAGHETEHRRGVGPKGRPPHTSAGACPPAALPRSPRQKSAERRQTKNERPVLRPRDPACRRRGARAVRASRSRDGTERRVQHRHVRRRLRPHCAGGGLWSDVRLGPRVLHRPVERVPGGADLVRRHDDCVVLAPLHARGARPRQDDAASLKAVPQHVPAVQLHDAAGADDQQHGHPVGGDGGRDADHRAAGQRLPHGGQPGGGVEVLHPVRRGHRAGAVRHRDALHGGREGGGRRRRRAVVDQPRRGEEPSSTPTSSRWRSRSCSSATAPRSAWCRCTTGCPTRTPRARRRCRRCCRGCCSTSRCTRCCAARC